MPLARPARWALLSLAVAGLTAAVDAVGIPSPALFAALLVGVIHALLSGQRLETPRLAFGASQAVVGVALGAYVQASTLGALGAHWAPVLAVSVATLAITVLTGLALSRLTAMDRITASFGMIAGGASGITAIADELGADARQVAVMQYLRVLVIVLLTPLVASVVFGLATGSGHMTSPSADPLDGLAFALLCTTAGVGLARLTRLPAGTLLGPMLVAAAVALSGLAIRAPVPGGLRDVAFAVIGLQVGLRFTPASLRAAGRSLPAVLGLMIVLLLACAGLGLLLAPLAGVSRLDAYLATTPGGLYAVLATAVGSGANTTFVLAVQVLRLFVMLLAAPPLARRLAGQRR